MHDAAHGTLFDSPWLNRFVGQWLCAAPVLADLDRYRIYHLEHHRTAGSSDDPDRSNYEGYPVSRKSFMRKIVRDLLGITGLKILVIVIKMNAGLVKYQLSYDKTKKQQRPALPQQLSSLASGLGPSLLLHALLFCLFLWQERPEVYGLWWLSWMSPYMLFSRIRNAAEHGATLNIHDLNPLLNTRTTLANWIERLTVAPNFVNYHLEHHLLPTIPPHNLRAFHLTLKQHGLLNEACLAPNYLQVIRQLIKVAPGA
jgi:fatty acid desaturase